MARLVNLQVFEAKNVICVWREDNAEKLGYECGIARDDALANFLVPRYIAVGTFSDGSTKAAGLQSLSDVNNDNTDDDDNLFLFNEFLHYVSLYDVKAFVCGTVKMGEYENESKARAGIYKELLRAGVEISAEAKAYLREVTYEGNTDN